MKKISFVTAAIMFVMSLAIGVGGILLTSHMLPDKFENSPTGQSILNLPVELTAALLAVTFGMTAVAIQNFLDARKTAASTDRKMQRILKEIPRLVETCDELIANPLSPTRYIWKHAAWEASEDHLEENLDHPGLFYALENFYMAAIALREADHDRARFIWDHAGASEMDVARIITKHTANLHDSFKTLCLALEETNYNL